MSFSFDSDVKYINDKSETAGHTKFFVGKSRFSLDLYFISEIRRTKPKRLLNYIANDSFRLKGRTRTGQDKFRPAGYMQHAVNPNVTR